MAGYLPAVGPVLTGAEPERSGIALLYRLMNSPNYHEVRGACIGAELPLMRKLAFTIGLRRFGFQRVKLGLISHGAVEEAAATSDSSAVWTA
jgi:hypothetical protein